MTRRNRDRLRMALCMLPLLLLLAHAAGWLRLASVERLDERIHDMRLLAAMPHTLDERVVIVDVDEASLSRVGHWPWSRNHVARMLDELVERQQVRAVGIDMVFAEADHSSGLAQLQRLAQSGQLPGAHPEQWLAKLAPELDFDGQLARAIQGRPIVLGYYFSSDAQPRIGELPAPVFSQGTIAQAGHWPPWMGYGGNIPRLVQAASAAGFFNSVTDPDGLVRTVPLLAHYEGGVYESLALATYRVAMGRTQLMVTQSPSRTQSTVLVLDAQGRRLSSLPLTDTGSAYVAFRGAGGPNGGSFRYVSAVSVLKGELPAGELAGRIVLVGSTAPGLQDMRATPVSGTYPGVEIHANLISAMLDSRLPQRPDHARGGEIITLLLVGLLLILLPRRLDLGAAALHLGLPLALLALNGWLYAWHGLILPLAAPLVLCVSLTAVNLVFGYLMENRTRRRLMHVFGTYVPPELVQEMLKRPDAYSMQASSRDLTVMFCDLQGFTRMSEHMAPAELQVLLNALFTELTDVIYAHGGTVDKYIGDCVMAFWGAPVRSDQHAAQATRAALAIQARVAALNTRRQAQGRAPLRLSIGINSGEVAVGDMGSHWRRTYTVIGDAVNLAARLEGLTRAYGIDIVAGDQTRALSPGFLWQQLDRVRVKGRERLEDIHTPICPLDQATPGQVAEVTAWNQAMDAHIKGKSTELHALLRRFELESNQNPLYCKFAEQHLAGQPLTSIHGPAGGGPHPSVPTSNPP